MTESQKFSFSSRSRFGLRLYQVADGRLKVSGKVHFATINIDVRVCDIEPAFESRRFIVFRFIRNCVLAMIAIWLAALLVIRWGVYPWVVILMAGLLSISFVRELLKWISPVELNLLRLRGGSQFIELARERGEEAEYDAFIAKLKTEIEKSQAQQA